MFASAGSTGQTFWQITTGAGRGQRSTGTPGAGWGRRSVSGAGWGR
jgi:hypothetical protein